MKFEFLPLNLSYDSVPYFELRRGRNWIDYGSDNLLPMKFVEFYNSSNMHSSIIKKKAKITVGDGLVVNEDNQELLNFFKNISKEDINELIHKMATDVLIFNTISLQAIWSRDGETVAKLRHLDFTKVRSGDINEITNEVEDYWISRDWRWYRKNYNSPISLPAFNPEKSLDEPIQVIYEFPYNPGIEFYPLPDYYSALHYISLEAQLAEYYDNFVANGLSANLVITMFGDPSPQERTELKRSIENSLQGSQNAGKFFLAVVESPEHQPIIQPLNTADNTKMFETLQGIVREEIMGVHGITAPEIVGLPSSKGTDLGGDANKLISAYRVLESSEITIIRNKIINLFNRILDINGIKYEKGDFFFSSSLPFEGEDLEVMTINERRERIGKEPIEGGDVRLNKINKDNKTE